VAIDEDEYSAAYESKPVIDLVGSYWIPEETPLCIPRHLVDYSGDWKDSLAAPPEPPFKEGELVVGKNVGNIYEWKENFNAEKSRRPTEEELKRWFPNRRFE
jgi:hypothetical protein